MAGDETEFKNNMAFLNLRGLKSYIEDALKEKTVDKQLEGLANQHASFVVLGLAVHEAGRQLKDGKVDCETVMELLHLKAPLFPKLTEYMDRLADAKDETMRYFNKEAGWDLDDEGLYERYKALARMTARTVHQYYAELKVRDRHVAEQFAMKVAARMSRYGCGKLLSKPDPAPPQPEKERPWRSMKQ